MIAQSAVVVLLADRRNAELRRPAAPAPSGFGLLAACQTTVSVAPDGPILWEGARADHLFRIAAGVVKIHRQMANGHCQIFGFLFNGDLLGLTTSPVHSYGAVALGPVTLNRFPRRSVERLAVASPLVARLLFSHACDALTAAQDQMLLLGRKTSTEKIATFLLAMARRTNSNDLDLPMTRVDVADYLGLAVETVSRILTQFREAGLLRVDRRSIQIADRESIETISNGG